MVSTQSKLKYACIDQLQATARFTCMQTLLDAVDGTLIFVAIELIAWWYLLFFLNENLIANTPIVSRRMMITPPRAPLTMKIIELLLSST